VILSGRSIVRGINEDELGAVPGGRGGLLRGDFAATLHRHRPRLPHAVDAVAITRCRPDGTLPVARPRTTHRERSRRGHAGRVLDHGREVRQRAQPPPLGWLRGSRPGPLGAVDQSSPTRAKGSIASRRPSHT